MCIKILIIFLQIQYVIFIFIIIFFFANLVGRKGHLIFFNFYSHDFWSSYTHFHVFCGHSCFPYFELPFISSLIFLTARCLSHQYLKFSLPKISWSFLLLCLTLCCSPCCQWHHHSPNHVILVTSDVSTCLVYSITAPIQSGLPVQYDL